MNHRVRTKLIAIIIIIILGINELGYAQKQLDNGEFPTPSYSYLKFSTFPFFYSLFRNPSETWIMLHYEWQPYNKRKISFNAAIEYQTWTYTMSYNGTVVSTIPNNVEFCIRPQVRFYTGKAVFKGLYIGLFPLYLYKDLPSEPIKGNYFGAGTITGYQFFLLKKIPIEFNFWIAWQTGMADQVDRNRVPFRARDSFARGAFELNIGLPIKRSK